MSLLLIVPIAAFALLLLWLIRRQHRAGWGQGRREIKDNLGIDVGEPPSLRELFRDYP